MKLLAIGPGNSTIQLGEQIKNLKPDIKTIGLHRAFPYLKQNHNIDLDYWTWGDPNSTQMGLNYIKNNPNEPIPHIILPKWFKTISEFSKHSGTSRLTHSPKRIIEYEATLNRFEKEGKVTYIQNALPTKLIKNQKLIKDPKLRFSGEFTIFGTVPFDGTGSNSNWANENKFTVFILPIAHHLKMLEVYCLGFDNRGIRIASNEPQAYNEQKVISRYMKKMHPWVNEWKEYHKMDIYSVAPDEFTPNNLILEYKPLKELLNG